MMTVRGPYASCRRAALLKPATAWALIVLAPDEQHGTPWTPDRGRHRGIRRPHRGARVHRKRHPLDLAAPSITRAAGQAQRGSRASMRCPARLDSGAFHNIVRAFHLTLAEAAHNNTLQHMVQVCAGRCAPHRQPTTICSNSRTAATLTTPSGTTGHRGGAGAARQAQRPQALRTIIKRGKGLPGDAGLTAEAGAVAAPASRAACCAPTV